jgi:hypothetical protein
VISDAVEQLVRLGFDRESAERQVRAQLGGPPPDPALSGRELNALEKQIEHVGDVLMQKLGFEVIRFSHPGKTKQTPGIPDRRYYRRPREIERPNGRFLQPALVVWVEYKSAIGRQRPGQKLFQEMAESCGEAYVLGGIQELERWLAAHLEAR